MHAVNWAEVLSKLAERGVDPRAAATLWIERGIVDQALSIDLGHADDAVRVAELRPSTRGLGLSLGDRYCLALGQRLGATVLTADRPWTTLTVGIMVEAIR